MSMNAMYFDRELSEDEKEKIRRKIKKAIDYYDTLIGFAISTLGIAIGKWLFGDRSG